VIDPTLRFRVAAVAAGLLFLVLWVRLVDLQVVRESQYSAIARENKIQIAVEVARRGLILDRNGVIIARNDPSYSVYILRPKARPLDLVVARLAGVLGTDSAAIMTKLRTSGLPRFEPVRVARHVPLETVCELEEKHEMLPGVFMQYESTRRYPEPAGSSHMIGYVDEPTAEEAKPGTPASSFVGVRGVEKRYDYLLSGRNGVRYLEVTAAGQVMGDSPDEPAKPSTPGEDICLSVDWELQQFCEERLAQRGTGSVVCLEPKTGAVLAIVNEPSFDPNLFSGVLTPESWQQVATDSTHPLLDRALKGLYPPGSTTKLITAAAGLELGLIAPTTRFSPCFGGMQFGNRYFRCWAPEGHGALDLAGAIEQSCDVYFYQLGMRMGVERWAGFARRCGFGKPTGIDLPNESSGLVPDSAYYNRTFGKRGWTGSLVLNLAIGQGEFLVTPMQLAVFYAAVANGGRAARPHILRGIEIAGTAHSIDPEPEFLDPLPMSPATIAILREGLHRVVHGAHGTARGLNYPDVEIAGKTGTAQNPHGDNHSWFACYAPADDPAIVVVAIAENAGHGSEVAAPLCGEIVRHFLKLPDLRRPQDITQSTPPADTLASGATNGL
jgi:penicillin-binding protein 2